MSKQFVIQLSHTPGALAALCRELEKRAVDLKAIGGGGVGGVGGVGVGGTGGITFEALELVNMPFL